MLSSFLPYVLAQGKGKKAPPGPLFEFKGVEADPSAVTIDQLDFQQIAVNMGIAAAAAQTTG